MRICTVGHGARSIEALLAVLAEAGVGWLVDGRRFPGSRRHPQFGREALADALGGASVRYTWRGDVLGGRRPAGQGTRHTALRNAAFAGYADHMDGGAFRRGVEELLDAAAGQLPAVLCAETLWWHCHRMLIADALVMRGAQVVHLLEPGVAQPHRLTDGVRRGDDGWPVYDDAQETLPGL